MLKFILTILTGAGFVPGTCAFAAPAGYELSPLVVDDPEVLELLDADDSSVLALKHQLKSIDTGRGGDAYSAMATQVRRDVDQAVQGLAIDWERDIRKTYLPSAAKTSDGRRFRKNGNVMRVFDANWLVSPKARFLLAGIVNRLDRRPFGDETACGEVRLIYRLGYVVKENGRIYASRMPFTVNLVYGAAAESGSCALLAKSWLTWRQPGIDAKQNAGAVLRGLFKAGRLIFKQLEINAQIARFPSDLEKDEKRYLAGQALYLMRVFALRNKTFSPVPLENTPDVALLRKNARKRTELASFIRDNIDKIDRGAFQIPEQFLTNIALTWSTQGSARTANRPWDHIFSAQEWVAVFEDAGKKGFDTENAGFISSAEALAERLNMSTCMGCHQTASTAGFHFLGHDRTKFGVIRAAGDVSAADIQKATDGNRLALAWSPHFFADTKRRKSWLESTAKNMQSVPFLDHPARPVRASKEAPCVPPNGSRPPLGQRAAWTCESGLTCTETAENKHASFQTGICTGPASSAGAGFACRTYKLKDELMPADEGLAWNLQAFRNGVTSDRNLYKLPQGKLTAGEWNCRPTVIGVPNGRISRNCTMNEKLLKGVSPASIESGSTDLCAVVGGKGFEEMARGLFNSEAFGNGVSRGMLNACHSAQPCREDYICQALPDFLSGKKFAVPRSSLKSLQARGIGFCTPTYFVYQLRLDGHPVP